MVWLFEPPTNVTQATDMVGWINTVTNMWLFQGIISSVFIISLVSILNSPSNSISKAFGAASFISMILAIFARTINLVPTWFMSVWIVLVGINAIWMYAEETR